MHIRYETKLVTVICRNPSWRPYTIVSSPSLNTDHSYAPPAWCVYDIGLTGRKTTTWSRLRHQCQHMFRAPVREAQELKFVW